MKKLFICLIFIATATLCFSFEMQIPVSFVHSNNFLSGFISETFNGNTILLVEHDYNIYKLGGGLGADFYIWQKDTFGFYFRFNYYNPYYIEVTNTKITTIFGSSDNFSDYSKNVSNSYALDLLFGITKKWKIKEFEIPIAWAFSIPRATGLDIYSSEIGREGIAEFGFTADLGLRYNVTKNLFFGIGGRMGVGFAFGGFPDYKNNDNVNIVYSSATLSGYLGAGVTLSRNRSTTDSLSSSRTSNTPTESNLFVIKENSINGINAGIGTDVSEKPVKK